MPYVLDLQGLDVAPEAAPNSVFSLVICISNLSFLCSTYMGV